MTLRFSILLLGILLLTSCEKIFDEAEIVESDYEPELNVFGLISFDSIEPSFVHVHRTLSLDENRNEDSLYFVRDAEVTIIESSGVSNLFTEIGYGYSNTKTYYEASVEFDPQFDTEYKLEINTPNGMSLTGTLHTPPEPVLSVDQIPEIIYPDSFFTLSWNFYANAMVRVQVKGWGDGCYINRYEYFEDGETEWTTKIFSCYDEVGGYNNPDSLSIQLTFMDINYYDCFVKNAEDNFLNFLMGISGNTRHRFGVEGGLGVFGSYATTTVILPFEP
tara:strand:+ start:1723 stop:2550 length:828 start_codon:yes stop_codon:yes gene_type:complete